MLVTVKITVRDAITQTQSLSETVIIAVADAITLRAVSNHAEKSSLVPDFYTSLHSILSSQGTHEW